MPAEAASLPYFVLNRAVRAARFGGDIPVTVLVDKVGGNDN